MWDSHIRLEASSSIMENVLTFIHNRLGGAAGTQLQTNCPTSGANANNCFAAFLALHLTSGSTAYLEVNLSVFDPCSTF